MGANKENEAKIMTLRQALKVEANGNDKIFNDLMYSSYAANRECGMTHEQCVAIGIGNTERLLRYVSENKNN